MSYNRGQLKTLIRQYLGTSDDDPAYDVTVLDSVVQQARDSVIGAIRQANPDYLSKSVTLLADTPTGHTYTFSTQVPAITDFNGFLEVRYKDEDGVELEEARLEELRDRGGDYFCMTGPDEAPVLRTSPDSPAGENLFLRYSYWPADFSSDSSLPTGVPSHYHDVVALESLFAYGYGGEQRLPPELRVRWMDRKNEMLAVVGRRGVKPSRSRVQVID